MTIAETLTQRNETFAATRFAPGLRMMPSLKTTIIGCVDPRVDPGELFGLSSGEAAVIRNVGGRIYPSTLQTMAMLRTVARANGAEMGTGWNLIVLHHTDCGIQCLAHSPEILAKHFGVEPGALDGLQISDPYQSVVLDVAALKANPQLPAGLLISGMVYDVSTGTVRTVVSPTPPGTAALTTATSTDSENETKNTDHRRDRIHRRPCHRRTAEAGYANPRDGSPTR